MSALERGEFQLRNGERIQHGMIIIEIMEVSEYKMPWGEKYMMVAYRIREGNFVSPVAHVWGKTKEDIQKRLLEVVQFYNQVRSLLHR